MFAVGVAIVSAAALAVVEWPYIRAWYRPPQAGLPAADDIVQMEAAAWAAGSNGNIETDLPRFVVPDPIAPRVWRRFTPNAYLPKPQVRTDAPLGEVVATTADGRQTRVLFYEAGIDDVIFTVDGKDFFHAEPRDELGHPLGGSLLLVGMLRHAAVTADLPDPSDMLGRVPMTDPAAHDDGPAPDWGSPAPAPR